MTDEPDATNPGDTIWYSTDPDSGPDVGIVMILDHRQQLYAGEMHGYPGWTLALRTGADKVVVATDIEDDPARQMIEAIATALTAAHTRAAELEQDLAEERRRSAKHRLRLIEVAEQILGPHDDAYLNSMEPET